MVAVLDRMVQGGVNPAETEKRVASRLLPYLFILYVAAFLDRINVSFAGLQMGKDLGFHESAFGLAAGMFFVSYCIFGVPSNLMAARFGPRRWLSFLMIAWALISMSTSLVTSDKQLCVLRFCMGAVEAGFFPGLFFYLTSWFHPRALGLAAARFMTAIPAASILGALVAAAVFWICHAMGVPGWRCIFVCTGTLSFSLGISVFFRLDDRPADARWLAPEERTWLTDSIAAERATLENAGQATTREALTNKVVWAMAILHFFLCVGLYGFQLWLPQIVRGFGTGSDFQAALLSGVPALFQIAGMLFIAWRSDRSGERYLHLGIPLCMAAASLVAAGYFGQPLLALLALSSAGFWLWGALGPFWAGVTARKASSGAAGIALINSVGNLGGLAGPYLVGVVRQQSHDFHLALWCMAVSLLIAGLMALALRASLTRKLA
jgi:MFS transporter, ACS family, tartrate transporter